VREFPSRDKVRLLQKRRSEALRQNGDAQVEEKELERAAKTAAEIKGLLIVGSSVFSYPGLLASGEISYVELSGRDPFAANTTKQVPEKWGYALDIGIPQATHQEFRVLFNEEGHILAICHVPNKR
jgi:hypothetical protein